MTSLWIKDTLNFPLSTHLDYESLNGLVFDVVIIGAGITGTSCAYSIMQQDSSKNVLIVEARNLCNGATGRNGGHLWPGLELAFTLAVEAFGLEKSIEAYEFELENVKAIREFIKHNNVQCDLQEFGSIYVVRFEEDYNDLKAEFELLKNIGIADKAGLELVDAEKVQEMTQVRPFVGGMLTKTACTLHPAKLVHAITNLALKLGAKLCTQTKVTNIEHAISSDQLHAITTTRGTCHAKKVVFANNAWINELLPFTKELITPTRGQIIATKPLSQRVWRYGLLLNDGYEYIIQRPDNRVILGGCRWKSPTKEQPCLDDSCIQSNVSQGLHEYLSENFQDLFHTSVNIEHEWTGIMAFSKDSMPLIGRVPNMHNVYMSVGYTGHGMPIAFLSARAIAEMVLDKEPQSLPRCYDPIRFL